MDSPFWWMWVVIGWAILLAMVKGDAIGSAGLLFVFCGALAHFGLWLEYRTKRLAKQEAKK